MKRLLLLLFIIPGIAAAQLKITGRVIDAANGKPIADASVFLNNETIGTKSAGDGSFTLQNIGRGQHEVVLSIVGYEAYRTTVTSDAPIDIGDVKMLPKTTMLKAVKVGYDSKWYKKLKLFEQQFIGTSPFSKQTKITNPDVLFLQFSRGDSVLTGNSDDFLLIENRALGYKLKYLLTNFVANRKDVTVTYEGSALFEELKGTPEQKVLWKKNREAVYYGSPTHFFREILANNLGKTYFVKGNCITRLDTLKRLSPSMKTDYEDLQLKDFIHGTDVPGVFAMSYSTNLLISYLPQATASGNAFAVAKKQKPVTVTSIRFIDKYLLFDRNGNLLNPTGAMFYDSWGISRVGQLLPLDYWPEAVTAPAPQETIWH